MLRKQAQICWSRFTAAQEVVQGKRAKNKLFCDGSEILGSLRGIKHFFEVNNLIFMALLYIDISRSTF